MLPNDYDDVFEGRRGTDRPQDPLTHFREAGGQGKYNPVIKTMGGIEIQDECTRGSR